jgi:nitroreductase
METFDAVRTVLATRQFRDTPIPDDVVREIVEAAHLTASASNAQPWRFIVVQNKDTLKQFGQLVKTGPYIPQAPLAIVVTTENTPFALSDGSRAIQSMVLTAWSHGVASNWVGFSATWRLSSPCWASLTIWMCWRLCRLAIRPRQRARARRRANRSAR